MEKTLCLVSLGIAAFVALVYALDLAIGVPFGRNVVQDAMFLIAAGMVLWQGFEIYRQVS